MGNEQNGEDLMTPVGWSLVAIAAQLLPRDEREAALGDLVESNGSPMQDLLDVLSLVLYRQAIFWKSWRPWLAAFGLTVPSSFLLMGASVSVSRTFLQLAGHKVLDGGQLMMRHDPVHLLCEVL